MSTPDTWLTGNDYGLASIRHDALRKAIGNRCLNFVGLVIGSGTLSAVDYDAFDYAINGLTYEEAAGTDVAITVLDYYGNTNVQAADTTCYYLIVINAAGTVYSIKGKDDETTDLPGIPDGYAIMGIIKIVTVGVTFTIGTTSFGASGITDTFTDCVIAPETAP